MFIKIGDKVVEVNRFETINGKQVPVIQATAREIKNPDGTQDVIVDVPCFKMGGEVKPLQQ